MKLEDNIDIYNDSAIILKQKYTFSKRWIIILIILTILFILISCIPFNIYRTYNGYIILNNNNSYINIKLENKDFPINKNKKLYIKNVNYKYEIININKNDVLIKINLKKDIKIDNNIVTLSILKDRTNLKTIIKNKIKKGFGL